MNLRELRAKKKAVNETICNIDRELNENAHSDRDNLDKSVVADNLKERRQGLVATLETLDKVRELRSLLQEFT